MRKERKKKRQSKEVRKEIRRILWNGLYILLTISVIVGFGLLDRNVGNFFHELGSLKLGWVLGAAGAMLMFWVMESGVFALYHILHLQGIWISKGVSHFHDRRVLQRADALFLRRAAHAGDAHAAGQRTGGQELQRLLYQIYHV